MALNASRRSVVFPCGVIFLSVSQSGDIEETLKLLKDGADPNSSTADGLTAHHQCCIDGNLEMLRSLVDHGADVNAMDNEGWTPLHAAASCDRTEIVSYLIEHGADLLSINSDGQTPQDLCDEDNQCLVLLQNAARDRNIDVSQARNHERELMMKDAIEIRDTGIPINANYSLKFGATPLHVASGKGYDDVVEVLLDAGLDVNRTDEDGWTPLHAAAHWNQERACELLCEHGADFDALSWRGLTCLEVADSDILDKLQQLKAAQVNKPTRVRNATKIVSATATKGILRCSSTVSVTSDDGGAPLETKRSASSVHTRLAPAKDSSTNTDSHVSPVSSRRQTPRSSPANSPRSPRRATMRVPPGASHLASHSTHLTPSGQASPTDSGPAELESCRCAERLKTLEQQLKKIGESFAKDRHQVGVLEKELKRVKEENQALIRVIAKLGVAA